MSTAIQKTEEKALEGEVVQVRGPALALREDTFEALHRQARALSPSTLVPKHLRGSKPEETLANVTLVLAYGAELGLGAVASISGIAVVNGRPFAESHTLGAVVRASGVCLYLRRTSASEKAVTWETHRHGEPAPDSRTFTMEQAVKAGLAGRDTYKQHPERMLSARALGWLLRDVYPDVVKGLGTEVDREEEEARRPPPAPGLAGAKEVARRALEAKTAGTVATELSGMASEISEEEKAAILAQEKALAEPGSGG